MRAAKNKGVLFGTKIMRWTEVFKALSISIVELSTNPAATDQKIVRFVREESGEVCGVPLSPSP